MNENIVYSNFGKQHIHFLFRQDLPSQGPSLQGSSITASKPVQFFALGSSQGQTFPPAGAGLSQCINFVFVPFPQIWLHSENSSSLQPPSTTNEILVY